MKPELYKRGIDGKKQYKVWDLYVLIDSDGKLINIQKDGEETIAVFNGYGISEGK